MIRADLAEQDAVEAHRALGVLRELLQARPDLFGSGATDESLRNVQLAIAGGLRSHGWTPHPDGWDKRPTRSRR